jgi:hypothetical protein
VLALIDADDPERSPLLAQALIPHGGSRRAPFHPGTRDQAYEKLASWVYRVAGKTRGKGEADPAGSGAAPIELPPAMDDPVSAPFARVADPSAPVSPLTATQGGGHSAANDRAAPATRKATPASSGATRVSPTAPGAPRPQGTLPRTAPEPYTPVDPFDPEIFNRRSAR